MDSKEALEKIQTETKKITEILKENQLSEKDIGKILEMISTVSFVTVACVASTVLENRSRGD